MKPTQQRIAGSVVVISSIAGMAIIQLCDPEMTQTQLLIAYWDAWLSFIFALCIGSWAITRSDL